MKVDDFDLVDFITGNEADTQTFECPFCLKRFGTSMKLVHYVNNRHSYNKLKKWLSVHEQCVHRKIEYDLNWDKADKDVGDSLINAAMRIFKPIRVRTNGV